MKSYGGLMHRIVSYPNVDAAVTRAARGKRERGPVRRFLETREERVRRLCAELDAGSYVPSPYTQFRILDPKPRLISCADFRDRVVHHAVCAVIGPLIDRRLIADTYACRKGKGSHRALLRARRFCRRYAYFLKTDVAVFFDSVDHEILLDLLGRLFRERALCDLLGVIVRHPLPGQTPGKGLPIGNLTSQWFANLYLDGMDHWTKEVRRIPGFVRYMDDMVFSSDSKDQLFAFLGDLREFLDRRRKLALKMKRTLVAPCSEGIPFLGWRVYPGLLRQQGRRLRRQRRLLKRREEQYLTGEITETKLQDCVRSMAGTRAFLGFGEPLRSRIES